MGGWVEEADEDGAVELSKIDVVLSLRKVFVPGMHHQTWGLGTIAPLRGRRRWAKSGSSSLLSKLSAKRSTGGLSREAIAGSRFPIGTVGLLLHMIPAGLPGPGMGFAAAKYVAPAASMP